MRGNWCGCLLATAILTVAAPLLGEVPEYLLGLPVLDLQFETDAPVDEEALHGLLPFRAGEPLRAADLQRARELLELKAIFREIRFEAREVDGAVALRVRLLRKYIIDRVRVRGARSLWERDVRRQIRLDGGMIFEQEVLDAAVQRLRSHYQKQGFPEATARAAVAIRDGEVDITVEVDEGAPLLIAGVVVSPEDPNVERRSLEEALSYLRGKRRSEDLQRESERSLLRLLRRRGEYEARVRSSWQPSSGNQGVLWYDVETGPVFELGVRGNESMRTKKLLGLMDIEGRLIITDGTWRELGRRMERAYQEAGYYRAVVDVKVKEVEAETGTTKHVLFEIAEGRKYTIRRVRFAGNRKVPATRLLDQMDTRPPRFFLWNWLPAFRSGRLLDDVLRADLREVRDFYRHQGFESATVRKGDLEVDDAAGRIEVGVEVEEGPQTIVEEVLTDEFGPLAGDMPLLQTRSGLPFDEERMKEDRDALQRAFARLGYTEAAVEGRVERKAADGSGTIPAVVTYGAVPGQRSEIGAIVVQGNIDTRSRVILRELPFVPGDPLNAESLLQGQANVYNLDLFRSVSVRPAGSGTPIRRDVVARVAERAPGRLEWGFGYNTRDGIGAGVDVSYDNLGGMARRVNLRAQLALTPGDLYPDQYLANLGYVEPRLLESQWKLKTNLIAERSTKAVDRFNIERVAAINSVDRKLIRRLEAGLELQAEQARVFNVPASAELEPNDEGRLRTIAVSPFLTWDQRNNPVTPTSGLIDSLRVRYAMPELSTVHFAKVTLRHVHYVPLSDGVGFLYAARAGWARPFDDSPAMPIRERFFLGGRNTVRGFSENSIGPKRGTGGDPIGGDVSVNFNSELTFPLAYGVGGAVFFDAGSVFLLERPADEPGREPIRHDSASWRNVREGAGFGLRYVTPVGPLSLDYGMKLDRRTGEDFGQLHFSIGTTF